eukprot:scaffold792_cov122-Isochrysis_galbana.AAC.4
MLCAAARGRVRPQLLFLSPSSPEKASTFEARALHARFGFGVRVLVFMSSATPVVAGVGL